MIKYFIRRLAFLFITLLFTSLIVFSLTRWLPGDICRVILGREVGEKALESCREELGLDQPPVIQYLNWVSGFLTGDWGSAFSTRLPIFPMVIERLENSLRLALLTMILAIPLAITLGVLAGLKENQPVDHVISIASLSVVGLPEFVIGLVLIQVFSTTLRKYGLPYLPANSSIPPDASWLQSFPMLILPAATATLVLLAYIARLTRVGVIEELKQPYVRTADLKGLPRRTVLFRHVLRNALLPTITVIAISFGWLISGLVVVENVFNYPGLGRLLLFAIDRRDLPLMQAIVMLAVVAYALANLIADLLHAILNPRIRLD